MNLDLFRADLADLAENVTPVDVRDRVLATSRRIGRRRAIGGVVAAVAFLAVAGGVAVAAVPDRGTAPILPPGDSTPRPTAPVTPDPTTAPSTPGTPDATESTQTSQATSAALGTLFYGPGPGTVGDRTRLFSWTGSGAAQRGAEIPRLAAMLNATVSPDGRRVAWVDDAAALYVADVDGGGKRKLLDSVDGQCWGPVWSGDSRTLGVAVVDRTGGDYKDTKGVYDFDQERFYEVRQVSGCHPVWSARGDTVVYSDGSAGKVMITGGTLRTPSAIKGIGGPGQPFSLDLSSISPDGTKIALLLRPPGAEGGDVARELRVNAVVRTSDGQPIDLPLDGRGMTQAFFQPDGGLVVRVEDGDGYALVLVSPDGEKVTEVAEPAALRDMQIVSVAG